MKSGIVTMFIKAFGYSNGKKNVKKKKNSASIFKHIMTSTHLQAKEIPTQSNDMARQQKREKIYKEVCQSRLKYEAIWTNEKRNKPQQPWNVLDKNHCL
jgi:hypothetical protein